MIDIIYAISLILGAICVVSTLLGLYIVPIVCLYIMAVGVIAMGCGLIWEILHD